MKAKKKKNWIELLLKIVAISSLSIGLIILAFFTFFLCNNFIIASTLEQGEIIENSGNIGDFFGGVIGSFWALTGVFLLYLTLNMQKEELVNQRTELQNTREVFEIQKFENTFFNLLQNQKHLLSELKIEAPVIDRDFGKFDVQIKLHTGTNALIECRSQLATVFDILSNPNSTMCDQSDFQHQLANLLMEYVHFEQKKTNVNLEVDIENAAFIDEANALLQSFKRAYYTDFFNIHEKDIKIFSQIDSKTKCELAYGIFFEKYGPTIGHYFRNFYHILKFLDKIDPLVKPDAKDQNESLIATTDFIQYAQFIQAQMSSSELLMVFYNASCFTKVLQLINRYGLLENLSSNLLIDEDHNGAFGITLKKVDSYFRQNIYNSTTINE